MNEFQPDIKIEYNKSGQDHLDIIVKTNKYRGKLTIWESGTMESCIVPKSEVNEDDE